MYKFQTLRHQFGTKLENPNTHNYILTLLLIFKLCGLKLGWNRVTAKQQNVKFNGEQSTTLVEQNPNYWKADEIDENNTPPWCHAKSFYYHWATDEPKNFKAVGKGYNLVTEKHRSEMSDSYSCESK